jgi:hypothetical protein
MIMDSFLLLLHFSTLTLLTLPFFDSFTLLLLYTSPFVRYSKCRCGSCRCPLSAAGALPDDNASSSWEHTDARRLYNDLAQNLELRLGWVIAFIRRDDRGARGKSAGLSGRSASVT